MAGVTVTQTNSNNDESVYKIIDELSTRTIKGQ